MRRGLLLGVVGRIDLFACPGARVPPDAPAMSDDIIPKLKCAKCGGKRVGLIYATDTRPKAKRAVTPSHCVRN